MKKLFISLPMNGRSEEEIKTKMGEYKRLADAILGEETELIDSYFEGFDINKDDVNAPIYYLGKSIQKMAEADFVVFGKGWVEARGCKIEYKVAETYNIPMLRTYGLSSDLVEADLFLSNNDNIVGY